MGNYRSLEETHEDIMELKGKIKDLEGEILSTIARLQKEAKKENFDMIRSLTNKMKLKQDRISTYKRETLPMMVHNAFKAEIIETTPGMEIVIETLDEILKKDIAWHEEVRGKLLSSDYDISGLNKTNMILAKMTPEEALRVFRNDLEARVSKFVSQIEDKVGTILSVDINRNANLSLDGYVQGEGGAVSIQTIIAGGYNIQRLHYRTLVKKVK